MLQKLDRMTMAASVEGRVPFASIQFQLAEQLEFNHFYRNKTLKWILKQAFKDDLPKRLSIDRSMVSMFLWMIGLEMIGLI